MIHAMVHKRLFVFYSNQSCCDLISSTILNVFSFDHDSDIDSFEQSEKKLVLQRSGSITSPGMRKNSVLSLNSNIAKVAPVLQKKAFTQELTCSDIVFTVLNISLGRIEPLIDDLYKEVNSLINDMSRRLENERMEVMERQYIAKQCVIDFELEIQNKLDLLEAVNVFNQSGVVRLWEVPFKIKFLENRLETKQKMLFKA
jgi:hypothetical protein